MSPDVRANDLTFDFLVVPLINGKKVACGAFFETRHCFPAAKSVVFAACTALATGGYAMRLDEPGIPREHQ